MIEASAMKWQNSSQCCYVVAANGEIYKMMLGSDELNKIARVELSYSEQKVLTY